MQTGIKVIINYLPVDETKLTSWSYLCSLKIDYNTGPEIIISKYQLLPNCTSHGNFQINFFKKKTLTSLLVTNKNYKFAYSKEIK
jgi:hypothetical protein